MTREELKILREIIDFINKENVYLYLTVRDYALANKPEWIDFLKKRKTIKFLILYTNSKKRVDKKIKARSSRENGKKVGNPRKNKETIC